MNSFYRFRLNRKSKFIKSVGAPEGAAATSAALLIAAAFFFMSLAVGAFIPFFAFYWLDLFSQALFGNLKGFVPAARYTIRVKNL